VTPARVFDEGWETELGGSAATSGIESIALGPPFIEDWLEGPDFPGSIGGSSTRRKACFKVAEVR
jgi:hypothetical protein